VKPYFDEDGCTIYHGDMMEILPFLDGIDLIVTDPPYGVGLKYGESHDDSPDLHWDWFHRVLSVMRKASPQVIFTHRQEALKHLTDWDHVCIWHKPFNLTFSIKGWQAKWEPVFVYGGVVTSVQKEGTRPSNTDSWLFNSEKNRHGHPAEKPVALMKEIIGTFSGNPCDPFMGSGTTLVAARDMGRKAIGIEIEEKYCEIAAKRLSQKTFSW